MKFFSPRSFFFEDLRWPEESGGKSGATIDVSDERAAFESVEETGKEGKTDESEKEGEESEGKEGKESSDAEGDEELAKTEEEGDEEEQETIDEGLVQRLKNVDKDVFKKIPELRATIFREEKYSEIFPTVEDAEEAHEALQVFHALQNDIISGDSSKMIESIDKADKEALPQFAANFLPNLEKFNRDLYHNIIAPHFKKFLRVAAKHSDENVAISARNINQWLFEDGDVLKEAGIVPGSKPKKDEEISAREKAFEEKQYNSFARDVNDTARGQLDRLVRAPFANTDLSPLIQKNLTKEIIDRINDEMSKDKRHLGNMNNLWNAARNDDFTTDGKNRIIRAYLSRAKVLISKVRAQVLSEAKVTSKAKSEEGEVGKPTRIPVGSTSSTTRSPGTKLDGKKVDWDNTDERALLDGKVTYRK